MADPKNHAEQLKRISEEVQDITSTSQLIGFLKGANIVLLLISALLVIAAIIAFISALVDGPIGPLAAFILLCLAAIAFILKILTKTIVDSLDDRTKKRLKRIQKELEKKAKDLEQQQQGGGTGAEPE